MKFHRKCGDRITLLNDNSTAIRNFVEFNHGLILSAEPLQDDIIFEVCIDRKVTVWNGSLEIGVTTLDPEFMELPATATKLRNTAWILSGSSVVKDGVTLINSYGPELDTLREGDYLGVMRTSKAELVFYVNGRCLGVAAKDMPPRMFAVIDLYGQCVQVSIVHATVLRPFVGYVNLDQIEECPNNLDNLNPTEGEVAIIAQPKGSGCAAAPDTYINMEGACALVTNDRLRFHPRCGILVKLSCNNKTAERARPLDDYNNGVVMTHRPLCDNELFEIRIDRLVDKWSGSIEVGVTTHNPATIRFPSTMTNMETGTIMMSGCKILLNGHGTSMEYGNFNLDELREGDTVGMMRKSNGKLHYFINGVDQGVATDKVAQQVWGVVDLYGMTVKVTIVDPSEEIDSNININMSTAVATPQPTRCLGIDEESLLFHTLRDSNVIIINDGKTAHRPNAFEYFNNGVVMTNRTLKTNELFQVRLDLVIPKWAGSIEIGVTQRSSDQIQYPYKMSNAKSGTWAMTGEDVIHDGVVINPQYVRNLNRLVEGETVGVMRKEMGFLHFFVNGVDQGPAACNVPENVYGIVDLYGRVAQATIVSSFRLPSTYSPESPVSSDSNVTIYPDMCFHRVHGRNARLSRNRLTASRASIYSEFNDAVLFSSRPLRECDMFELRIDKMVDCWIGSLEIGVTAIRPDDLESGGGVGAIAGTATDLTWDTYILSGAAMMKDGECVRSGYPLDLDTLTVGSRVGMMWHADRSLHYYLDGMDMGKAWYVPHLNIYAVVDLYGQCTQVTIMQNEERAFNYNGCTNSDNSLLSNSRAIPSPPPPYWSFSEYCGDNICLMHDYSVAQRLSSDPAAALVFSATHLIPGEIFEVRILECKESFAGGLRVGVTDVNILNAYVNRSLPPSVSYLPHYTAYIDGRHIKYSKNNSKKRDIYSFVPSFDWLRPGDRIGLKKTHDEKVNVYYNSDLVETQFEKVPEKVYVVMELYGSVRKIQVVTRGVLNIIPTVNTATIQNDASEKIFDDGSTISNMEVNGSWIPTNLMQISLDIWTRDTFADSPTPTMNSEPIPETGDPKDCERYDSLRRDDIAAQNKKVSEELNYSQVENNFQYQENDIERKEEFCFQGNNPTESSSDPYEKDDAVNAKENNSKHENCNGCPSRRDHFSCDSDGLGINSGTGKDTVAGEDCNGYGVRPSNKSDDEEAVGFDDDVSCEIENDANKTEDHDKQINVCDESKESVLRNRNDKIISQLPMTKGAPVAMGPTTNESRRYHHPLPYTFHYIHGKNLRLCSSDTVAYRFAGFRCGIAISSQPLRRGYNFRFRVDKVTTEWTGSVAIGAVGMLPTEELPDLAMHLDPPLWILTSDILQDNGNMQLSEMGMALDDIDEQSVLTIHFRFSNDLVLEIDGKVVGTIATIPRNFNCIYPMIDLYGKVVQVSILLHPHVHTSNISGASLDLPIIEEKQREELMADHERSIEIEPPYENFGKPKAASDSCVIEDAISNGDEAGPSRLRTSRNMPLDIDMSSVKAISRNSLSNLNTDVDNKGPSSNKFSLHQSFLFCENASSNIETDSNKLLNTCIQKSHSTHNFTQTVQNINLETQEQTRHSYSIPSQVEEGTNNAELDENVCDTNIQHNDRYPEASEVDNLDMEIMEALTIETGNLPDLSEEQSSSIDDSTRRDDYWSETLSIENLNYLNRLLCIDLEDNERQNLDSDWEASEEGCEHLHLVLKYWLFLVKPYPELRAVVSWGQVRCYCSNCQPHTEPFLAGWVRMGRSEAGGGRRRALWHVSRHTLGAAQLQHGPTRRPRSLVPLNTPLVTPPPVDIWIDEEGKPHDTVLAIEIDVDGSNAENDRLVAFLILLKPHVLPLDDNPLSLEEEHS